MKEESFNRRYFIKISSSIIIAFLNIIIQMILPRALTIEEFGYYSYNLNVFTSTVVLANLSMSNALVAKFSKRNYEIGLVYFYLKYYLLEIIVLSVGLVLLFSSEFVQKTFTGQTIGMVLLGLEVAAVTKFLTDVVSIYDAMAITRISASFQIVLKVFLCLFITISFFIGSLNLTCLYFGQFSIILIISIILLIKIFKYQQLKYPKEIIASNSKYIEEYTSFCKPMFFYIVFSQIGIIIMNWCLMQFSGAKEQAMFGAAWQLNALVAYVFSPYAELSKREYAIISHDIDALKSFYSNSLKRMLWLTAYFACFIGFCSDWILQIVYGDKYSEAGMVTLLFMLYTIYQSWGQMSGSFMFATERTKMSAILGIVSQIITLGLVFLFQIPNFIWPNGLGAIGIVLVYVVGNFISVCLSVIVTTYSLQMNVMKILLVQGPPIILCSLSAYILNKIFNYIVPGNNTVQLIGKLLISGSIYTSLILLFLCIFPCYVALNRAQLKELLERRFLR